jgi:excisionase family DNA binding protein
MTVTTLEDAGLEPASRTEDEPLLLTVEDAAKRLRIGRTRMWHLVTEGTVESVLIGRSRRVPTECLRAYVAALRKRGSH